MADHDPATTQGRTQGRSAAQRERRRRILAATVELATEGGFDAVQMREVADRADVALGTLYRYFPSKVHLLVSLLRERFEEAESRQRSAPAPGATAQERVRHVLEGQTRALQREPLLTEAMTRAFMFADSSVAEEIHRVEDLVGSLLTGAMAAERPGHGGGAAYGAGARRRLARLAGRLGDRQVHRRRRLGPARRRRAPARAVAGERGVPQMRQSVRRDAGSASGDAK